MAVGAYALTTNAKLQSFVGSLYAAADETLWNMLIDQATGIIERYTQRQLKSRDYVREIYNGNGGEHLYLRQWPVSQVKRVTVGRVVAFSVKNTTATTRAEVEVTPTSMILRADGATSPTTITLTTPATINALIALINAVSGWSAELIASDYGSVKATECLRRPAMACKDQNVAGIEIPDEDMTDYYLENPDEDRNAGILILEFGFESGVQNIFVDYTAGYATIPDDLEGACLMMTKYLYDRFKKDMALQSETLGDYSYTLAAESVAGSFIIPANLRTVLDYYKRVSIL